MVAVRVGQSEGAAPLEVAAAPPEVDSGKATAGAPKVGRAGPTEPVEASGALAARVVVDSAAQVGATAGEARVVGEQAGTVAAARRAAAARA